MTTIAVIEVRTGEQATALEKKRGAAMTMIWRSNNF